MKKPNYTKGPWKVNQNSRRNIMIHSVLGRQVAKTILHPGDVPEESMSTFKGSPQDFANAHLIAAAPEMLEALEIALIRLEQLDTPRNSNAHTIGQVFGAIKKARGES